MKKKRQTISSNVASLSDTNNLCFSYPPIQTQKDNFIWWIKMIRVRVPACVFSFFFFFFLVVCCFSHYLVLSHWIAILQDLPFDVLNCLTHSQYAHAKLSHVLEKYTMDLKFDYCKSQSCGNYCFHRRRIKDCKYIIIVLHLLRSNHVLRRFLSIALRYSKYQVGKVLFKI